MQWEEQSSTARPDHDTARQVPLCAFGNVASVAMTAGSGEPENHEALEVLLYACKQKRRVMREHWPSGINGVSCMQVLFSDLSQQRSTMFATLNQVRQRLEERGAQVFPGSAASRYISNDKSCMSSHALDMENILAQSSFSRMSIKY